MRAIMKKNAMAIKNANKPKKKAAASKPASGGGPPTQGDDEKSSGNKQSSVAPSSGGNVQYVANAASNEEVYAFVDEEKQSRNRRRLIVGTGASIHDLFENFLLSTIGMPHYLERFKTAGANDIRMVEHFDVPFLKETIGVMNKLEGKLLVKFIGKFNEETMQFREWLKKQNVMRAYVNTFESKGIITWGILSDYCETIEAVQDAFRIKNKAHAHFLYTQLERYRNGELSDAAGSDSDDDSEDDSSEEESD